MKRSKSTGKGCLISVISFFLIFILYSIFSDSHTNSIENTSVTKHHWRSPGDKLTIISKIMIQNNVTGCGEYYISEITNGEFAVACTSDGVNWTYYVVYPRSEERRVGKECRS